LFGPVFVIAMWASRRREHTAIRRARLGDRHHFYLSSDQHAFTSRTTGYIVPQHFPPGVTIRHPARAPIRTP
ncbi:MAG TPA: hypothetical protein VH165_09905, partial [Kofleriaceae bacterium]|nr:hypothetical protein [Kofleriaceae bacterium]